MRRKLFLSPFLLAVALSPAVLQGTCSPKSGNPDLLTLEIEAGGLDRLVGFDTDTLAYSVWLNGAATFIVRATAEDSNTAIGVWVGATYVLMGNGSGETTINTPVDGTTIVVQTQSSGGDYKNFQVTVNPACSPGDCDDADDCTSDFCNTSTSTCEFTNLADGTSCDGVNGTCQSGICVDNCTGVDCSDGNECTQDVCDSAAGGMCSNPPGPAGILCDAGGGPGTGQCDGAGACAPIDPSCLQPVSGSAPTACRNSFDSGVIMMPVDMTIALDRCVHAGQPFDATVTPAMTIPIEILQQFVDTLCAAGTTLTEIQIDTTQVLIDALAGATCTPALSELSPVPQTVPLDITVNAPCGAGNDVTVNTPVVIPLPQVTLSCMAGAASEPVAFCADGTTPLSVTLATPPVETFLGITVAGGAILTVFQCGGAATTNPAPGVLVSCTDTNVNGGLCGATVGSGNFGETPFPTSDCNFGFGFPGRCDRVPVAADPATDCVTVPIECGSDVDCDDGNECTSDVCNTTTEACEFANVTNGTSCDGGNGSCQTGVCIDNCNDCSDGNVCTQDVCDSATGGTCSNPPGPAGPLCDAGGGPGTGQCDGFGACPVIDPLCLQPVTGAVPTACRSSFNGEVVTMPVDLTVTPDRCVYPGQPFEVTVTPTVTIPQAELDLLAQAVCLGGGNMGRVLVYTIQAAIDALAGATCTPVVSELSPTPRNVDIDVTILGAGCGRDGGIVVNAPLSTSLPAVTLSCTADGGAGPVALCAAGVVPSTVADADTPVDTYIEIANAMSFIDYACGPGVASADNMSVDPIDPVVDCVTIPFE